MGKGTKKKKLSLNKRTVAKLTDEELSKVGGGDDNFGGGVWTVSCATAVCTPGTAITVRQPPTGNYCA